MRLTPVENSSKSCKKVGQGTGWLPGVWKLKWGRIRIPAECKEVDVVDVDVRVFSFCPPPVSQVQKLHRKSALWSGK